jgi:probable HAF family extracellular repeat protein
MRTFLSVSLAFALLASYSPAQEYLIVDLGTLGGETSEANAINATGQVAGTADTGTVGVRRAFLWESGVIFNLGVIDGGNSAAFAINDAGIVVGSSSQKAARFSVSGVPQEVGPNVPSIFPGNRVARGINASGDICGTMRYPAGPSPHTIWTDRPFVLISGGYSELPTLGGSNGYAHDINDSGMVVGASQIAGDAAYNAFRDSFGLFVNMGTLGGTNARANAINSAGDFVGYSDILGSAFHRAFLYRTSAGVMTDLGTLSRFSEAMALNSQRVVVGYSFDANGVSRAVRFSGGQVADLNTLIKPGSGWLLTTANGINDSGLIVGTGTNPSGKTRGFLLRPDLVPPSVRFSKSGTVRTEVSRYTVKGTAADNLVVKRIEYQVGRGPFKRAAGGTNWSFKAKLRPGKNRITVRAVDGAGNLSRTSTLTIIRS